MQTYAQTCYIYMQNTTHTHDTFNACTREIFNDVVLFHYDGMQHAAHDNDLWHYFAFIVCVRTANAISAMSVHVVWLMSC